MENGTATKFGCVGMLLWGIVIASFWVTVGAVAWHFISKFW